MSPDRTLSSHDFNEAAEILFQQFSPTAGAPLLQEVSAADVCKAWPVLRAVLLFIPTVPRFAFLDKFVKAVLIPLLDRWIEKQCGK